MSDRVFVVLGSVDLGGSESLGLTLAAAWGPGMTVVFMTGAEGPARARARALGLDMIDIPSSGRFGLVRGFRRLVRTHRPSAVLAFMFGAHLWLALGTRLGGGSRFLAFVGNPAPLDSVRRKRTRLAARAAQRFVTKTVACSDYVARSIRRAYGLGEDDVVTIWNWCDVDGIAARATDPANKEAEVVGMIARLDPIKDHLLLLDAFARVIEQKPQARLRFVGDGSTRQLIELKVRELGLASSVELPGAVEDPVDELTGFDVFAFSTTVDEGFGVVLAEAMAAGVPIVATRIGPVEEVLADGRGGRLVPADNAAALADEIVKLLSDAGLRDEMAEAGLELAQERYTVGGAVRAIRKLIDG